MSLQAMCPYNKIQKCYDVPDVYKKKYFKPPKVPDDLCIQHEE